MGEVKREVRVLSLKKDNHEDSTLYRLKKGWTIQFRLSPSLFGTTVTLFTNHPSNDQEGFTRCKYRKLNWQSNSKTLGHDDTAVFTDVKLVYPGSFHFYYTYEGSDVSVGSGYFVVDPTLTYGPDDDEKELPLDSIQCQTHLSKCLGPFDQWKQRLLVTREAGYNMIHFTPVQELGRSQSSYSLSDQHKLNHAFNSATSNYTLEDVDKFVQMMRKDWKVLSLTDIVLNHSANESVWLKEHPECAYNLKNSPHLKPAFIFDVILWQFAVEIADGKWESSGIPKKICHEEQLQAVKSALLGYFLPQVKLHEFYMVDVKRLVDEFRETALGRSEHSLQTSQDSGPLKIVQDFRYRRFQSTVDTEKALLLFNTKHLDFETELERVEKCCANYQKALEELNHEVFERIHEHLKAGVNNVLAGMRYQRLQHDGPQVKEVSAEHPLVPRYFTHYGPDLSFEKEEELMHSDKACFLMAHNGWVMNDDPLRNFAESDSNVYIRRELIAWGDSVKLRYGSKPEDCPYLWNYMKVYVETTAKIFHGIRLDNCHSTPIHVAQFLLDAARKIRPELYVVAELFTANENTDNIFINKLGINSLIREAMSAHDSHEEGRLVYRYGGDPVGAFYNFTLRPLVPSIAHAIFFDQTHDNPSPVKKRSVYDLLPSAALVNMACCATGSNRGYDELVPHEIDVVKESRLYPSWSTKTAGASSGFTDIGSGIILGRKLLHDLHFELGYSGFSQVYVDQVDADIVAVTRHCPSSHQSVILVAFTAFSYPNNHSARHVPPLCVQGVVDEIILEAHMVEKDSGKAFSKDSVYINGIRDVGVEVKANISLDKSEMIQLGKQGSMGSLEISFKKFTPGSIVAIRVSVNPETKGAILQLRKYASLFGYNISVANDCDAEKLKLVKVISQLNLVDLNRILFRCDSEEQDDRPGNGVYVVPRFTAMPYAGLQGLVSFLKDIHTNNDLGQPLCENIRQGNWLAEYIVRRLQNHTSLNEFASWLSSVLKQLNVLPRYLIPSYFDAVICGVYSLLLTHVWKLMSDFVSDGTEFIRALALGSVILCGYVQSAPLPQLSSSVSLPLPPSKKLSDGQVVQACTTLSAGLPHFSTGYMRNWGRDTFIALRGLLLLTGRYDEARFIILGFGGCLRHGLIPNLLDGGRNARFNCRDAVWLWLQSIQDYAKIVPSGHSILQESVRRLFSTDEAMAESSIDQPLEDVIHEALQRHYRGVSFRERNAGYNLDRQMSDLGFNNCIGVDSETGFVFGGNVHNCGTWMDKMGSSDAAGNKGVPATPRDGSAVEIVGLCKSTLRWLIEMNKAGFYSYDSVTRIDDGQTTKLSLVEWNEKIQKFFEERFWIKPTAKQHGDPHPELVNRTCIYKDTHGATHRWADYQLRCNFPFAMVVAPELFTPANAWEALNVAEEILLGPLGMKTLDPSDWAYEGNYDNDNDSTNPRVARGFNYHQGPEWLWPVGYFLRSKLHFAKLVGGQDLLDATISRVKTILSAHYQEVNGNIWMGLPELTNKDGEYCQGSCRVQAWSMSSILEVLYDICNLK